MSWLSAYNPSVSFDAYGTALNPVSIVNPAACDPLAWPAHDMTDGLDLPTFDMYVKCVIHTGTTSNGLLGVLEQEVSVGKGLSFNVLRRSHLVIRKYADQVEFQGPSRVSYAKLKSFIQELLVLYHPHLQRRKVLIGLIGFAWDIKPGLSDLLTVATPALDLEFAEHGNLAQYLDSKPLSQSLSERKILCGQILEGLSCLHECFIVHGDLKLENILVCSSETGPGIVAKLSDFGLSMFVIEKDPTPKKLPGGTQPWNSPEWRESRPSKDFYKSDMYSVGLLIWATFSLGEDPFNLEGRNIIGEEEFSAGNSCNLKEYIENLKRNDKLLEIACRATATTLASLDTSSGFLQKTFLRSKSYCGQSLLKALIIVFENTLQFNPVLRSLEPGIKALKTDTNLDPKDENEDESSPWWGAMYLNPCRVSPKSFQQGLLRGYNYLNIPGAPMVSKLSVAISKAICLDSESFTIERRRDAAFFLFRSYFESYGMEENQHNMKQAIHWLHEFARLGIACETEDLCFAVAEYSRRINHDLPLDFPLEISLRSGLQSILKGGLYITPVCQERTQNFPNLFNAALISFREEGFRRLLPQKFRSANLSAILSSIGSENSVINAAALLHIAASCGDIHTASLLVEKHDIDPNVKVNFGDFTPLITALKFSQTQFVLWLLRQGVRAGLEDQSLPVLCFISNFDSGDVSSICSALCQAGASVNDTWYFEYLFTLMNMLSFAAWNCDLATIEIMLAQQPSILTCQHALRWACSSGRLDVVKKMESHLTLVFESPPDRTIWEGGLSDITNMSPYQKLSMTRRPDFIGTTKYIIERIGGELGLTALGNWLNTAITTGDCESLCLCLEQSGSSQLLRRYQDPDGKGKGSLGRSALEWAVILDRKAIFDILISKGSPIELEQSKDKFPTLLHCVAQRGLFNGKYICDVILAKGDRLEVRASEKLSGATAFEVAIRYNNYEIADFLLHKGACIDGYEHDRPTPLGDLINSHSRDAMTGIRLLLEHPRGKPSFIVDREQGRTALHLASGPDYDYDWQYLTGIDDQEAIMDMILAHYNESKHLNARDKCGFTALHHASYRGCDWAVKKLLKAGADPNLHSCLGIRPLDCAQHTWGLSLSMEVASPNFNVSSPASKIRSEAARLQCLELLTAAGAGDIVNSIESLGFRKYVMGCLGLINNAKEDHEIYEPWIGEFPLKSVTKWLVKLRNRRSQLRIAT